MKRASHTALGVLGVVIVVLLIQLRQTDERERYLSAINLAGKHRMLTQRIVGLSIDVARAPNQSNRAALSDCADTLQRSWTALLTGDAGSLQARLREGAACSPGAGAWPLAENTYSEYRAFAHGGDGSLDEQLRAYLGLVRAHAEGRAELQPSRSEADALIARLDAFVGHVEGTGRADLQRDRDLILLLVGCLVVLVVVLLLREAQRRREETFRLRSENARIADMEGMLRDAQFVAGLGSRRFDARTGEELWSEELYRLLGYDPAMVDPSGELFTAAVHEEDRALVEAQLQRQVQGADPEPFEFRIVPQDGQPERIVRATAVAELDEQRKLRRMHGTVLDITRQHALEQRLAQSQRLKAVGELAAGVAHDFNNVLAVVQGHADTLAIDRPDDARVGEFHTVLTAMVDRASALTRRLLSFSRRQRLNAHTVNLRACLEQLVDELGRTLGEDCSLVLEVEPGAPEWAQLDESQFQTALLNLVINARDAMSQGGEIRIVLRRLDIATLPAGHELSSGDYVAVDVRDAGDGMPEEVASRVFEPFFTTKNRSNGAGLGLSMVYGFVEQSAGDVWIESQPGGGTTVTLVLPSTDPPATMPARESRPQRRSRTGRAAKILLVEDDDAVRRMSARILQTGGHEVVEASRGAEAIERIRTDPTIEAVVTDVVMPGGVYGWQVASAALAQSPPLPVLVVSGYAERLEDADEALPLDLPILSKPFRPQQLLDWVAAALAVAESGASAAEG